MVHAGQASRGADDCPGGQLNHPEDSPQHPPHNPHTQAQILSAYNSKASVINITTVVLKIIPDFENGSTAETFICMIVNMLSIDSERGGQ